jgi:hypothetical protein
MKSVISAHSKIINEPGLDTKNLISVREYIIEAKLHNMDPFVAKIGMKAKTYSRLNHVQFVKYPSGNYYTSKAIEYGIRAVSSNERPFLLQLPESKSGRPNSGWSSPIMYISLGKSVSVPLIKRHAALVMIYRYVRGAGIGKKFKTTIIGAKKGEVLIIRVK